MYLNSVTRMCVYEGIPLTAIILLNPMLYIYIYMWSGIYIFLYDIQKECIWIEKNAKNIYDLHTTSK